MKAIGFKSSIPISDKNSLIEFETEKQTPTGHDVLVQVYAASVNPVDYKIRKSAAKDVILSNPKILGFDAAGKVVQVGDKVESFKPGDEVYYAGDISRPGSNAEFQLVDERIIGFKPKSFSFAEAAALPLTTLTAWELIFDRMNIRTSDSPVVLIIGGAGGVGSVAIQLLKKLTKARIIATASRKETDRWCRLMGADMVVNHYQLLENLEKPGFENAEVILNFTDTSLYWEAMAQLIAPQGKIGCIVPPTKDVSLGLLYEKSVSFHWELMFTRSKLKTYDMIRQQEILNETASLADQGILNSTLTTTLKGFHAENLRKAHEILESGKGRGKIVVDYGG